MALANEKEGKGRSENHPCERLKFLIFPTVVTLGIDDMKPTYALYQ